MSSDLTYFTGLGVSEDIRSTTTATTTLTPTMELKSASRLSLLKKWVRESPPAEWAILQIRNIVLKALRFGPIPQHIAFVMDGNRRFARLNQIETIEGHSLGFEALARTLELCYKSGVRVVTAYAFSIENFKRSSFEVDSLMDMAKVKLIQLAQHGELLDLYGVKMQFLGNRELVRHDLIKIIDQAMEMTSKNDRAILNICAPYTSRDEIAWAIRETVIEYAQPTEFSQSIHRSTSLEEINVNTPSDPKAECTSSPLTNHIIIPADEKIELNKTWNEKSNPHVTNSADQITSQTISKHMFTSNCPPLDILVRTSGVKRLSDFMLWQCHETTEIYIINCLWPKFSIMNYLSIILEWQWRKLHQNSPTYSCASESHSFHDNLNSSLINSGHPLSTPTSTPTPVPSSIIPSQSSISSGISYPFTLFNSLKSLSHRTPQLPASPSTSPTTSSTPLSPS